MIACRPDRELEEDIRIGEKRGGQGGGGEVKGRRKMGNTGRASLTEHEKIIIFINIRNEAQKD